MNISWLLIEISQNEKGLYKLTFIINKCNTHTVNSSLSLSRSAARLFPSLSLSSSSPVEYAAMHQPASLLDTLDF